jgi:hypothetical protein
MQDSFLFNYLPTLITELPTMYLPLPFSVVLLPSCYWGPNHSEMESWDDAYALKTHQEFGALTCIQTQQKKDENLYTILELSVVYPKLSILDPQFHLNWGQNEKSGWKWFTRQKLKNRQKKKRGSNYFFHLNSF